MAGMRQLQHPAIADVSVEGILHALSDPVRAQIYARICASGESPPTGTRGSEAGLSTAQPLTTTHAHATAHFIGPNHARARNSPTVGACTPA